MSPRTWKDRIQDIIGEAATHIPEEVQENYPEIPWNLMRALRNRIVHVYFSLDPKIVWDTIQKDLPPITSALEKII